jgi:hypothetical protein
MDALTLNYWLSKFVMEVAKESGERYPPRSIHGIIAGLKRHPSRIQWARSIES